LFVSISSFKYYLSFSDELIPERAEGRKSDGAVSLVAGGRAKEKRERGVLFFPEREQNRFTLFFFLLPHEREIERENWLAVRGAGALSLYELE
jgi:hypothetical protein